MKVGDSRGVAKSSLQLPTMAFLITLKNIAAQRISKTHQAKRCLVRGSEGLELLAIELQLPTFVPFTLEEERRHSPSGDPVRFLPVQVNRAASYSEHRKFNTVIDRW